MCPVLFFFFSSRRRHTRFDCDWSSDVCSSDLFRRGTRFPHGREHVVFPRARPAHAGERGRVAADRSEERRVGKSVDLGGRRIIKKKKKSRQRERGEIATNSKKSPNVQIRTTAA